VDQDWLLDAIEGQMVTRWTAEGPQGLGDIRRGFVKRDEVALVATHRHSRLGNEIYLFGYVFKYAIDLPAGATAIVLPRNDKIRIFAITASNEASAPVRPASLLYAGELGK